MPITRGRVAGLGHLLAQVLHLEPLDRMPVQVLLLRHVLDPTAATAFSHVARKTLGVQRVLQKRVQSLALHGATVPAFDPPYLQFQIDTVAAAGQVSRPTHPLVVPDEMRCPTGSANCFFSPPNQTDEPRLRVTEDAMDLLQGSKTGESICVRQTTDLRRFGNPYIMPK